MSLLTLYYSRQLLFEQTFLELSRNLGFLFDELSTALIQKGGHGADLTVIGGACLDASLSRSARASIRKAAAAVLIALTATSCASRPGSGVLKPVEYSAPGAKLVTVYVATTRQRAALGENIFTAGRSPSLNLVKYTISIPVCTENSIRRRRGERTG